jgi:hypothetical protein
VCVCVCVCVYLLGSHKALHNPGDSSKFECQVVQRSQEEYLLTSGGLGIFKKLLSMPHVPKRTKFVPPPFFNCVVPQFTRTAHTQAFPNYYPKRPGNWTFTFHCLRLTPQLVYTKWRRVSSQRTLSFAHVCEICFGRTANVLSVRNISRSARVRNGALLNHIRHFNQQLNYYKDSRMQVELYVIGYTVLGE